MRHYWLAIVASVSVFGACSGSPNIVDGGSTEGICKQAGAQCTKNEDCEEWDCHCPEDRDGGFTLYPSLCRTNNVCATGVQACDGVCATAVGANQPTSNGCR